jgi:hypothetical protein
MYHIPARSAVSKERLLRLLKECGASAVHTIDAEGVLLTGEQLHKVVVNSAIAERWRDF